MATTLSRPGAWLQSLRLLALAAYSFVPLGYAASTPGEVVELPTFVVTDTRVLPQPEHWSYASVSNIEVLSNASDRATRQLVRDIDLFLQAAQLLSLSPNRDNIPVYMVVCRNGSDFAELMLGSRPGGEFQPASAFFADPSRVTIVVSAGAGNNPTRQIYQRYVQFLLSQHDPQPPAWFEEGLRHILLNIELSDDFLEVGRASLFNRYFNPESGYVGQPRSFVPLSELIEAGRPASRDRTAPRSLVPTEYTYRGQLWSMQCYAFVHLCLFGDNGKWRKPVAEFLTRGAKEPVNEALFKECFGVGYKEMATTLRMHCDFTDHEVQQFRPKRGKRLFSTAPVVLREATQSEVGRIKGYTLFLAKQPDRARNELIAPYLRGERDPNLLAALGALELKQGKPERARRFLMAATKGETRDPTAYLALARDAHSAATTAPAGPDGRFSAEQTAEIVGLLSKSLAHPPPNSEACELLVDTWARSVVSPSVEQVETLIRIAVRYPGNLKFVYAAALFSMDAELAKEGGQLIEHGLKFAPDQPTRHKFELLAARMKAPGTSRRVE